MRIQLTGIRHASTDTGRNGRPTHKEGQTMAARRVVKIIRTSWIPGDAEDGSDIEPTREDYDAATVDVIECDDIEDAVRALNDAGVNFEATGNHWAGDPDGSYVRNYATGERVQTSGHLEGWNGQELDEIMRRVG